MEIVATIHVNGPQVNEGDHVIFVDEQGREANALVVCVFGPCSYDENDTLVNGPAINLAHVTLDDNRRDGRGAQIERHSSVVHKTSQWAHGNYWKFPNK